MSQFTPLLMTAADRHSLLSELGAAGLGVAVAPLSAVTVASSAAVGAPAAASCSSRPLPDPKAFAVPSSDPRTVDPGWSRVLHGLMATVRSKLEAAR